MASLASFPKLAGAKLAERGFLLGLGLGLRASRFSTWRASLRFWRLRLVIVLSHGFRLVQRFNGGSQAVRASDGILIVALSCAAVTASGPREAVDTRLRQMDR
jgi:hypothetical protein